MSDWCHRSAGEQAAAVRSGAVTSAALVEAYLARCDPDPDNAVVTLVADRARAEAAAADVAVAADTPLGPLHGVPFTAKDAFATAGVRSTCGAPELAGHVPDRDAVAVQRLRTAGAVLIGKTNCSTWCADIQVDNPLFGPTTNPWSRAHTCGGSSAGAAAVAGGRTGFDLGTDIGGSVRVPAAFCGVFAHKPSYGIVPSEGQLGGARPSRVPQDVNVVGPIARSAADLELLLDVLAGPDERAATAWSLTLPPARPLADCRVAIWSEGGPTPVTARQRERLDALSAALRDAGVTVTAGRPPVDVHDAGRLWREIALATMAPRRGDGDAGRRAAGNHLDWIVRHDERLAVQDAWARWFTEIDLLVAPVWPDTAFVLDPALAYYDRTVDVGGEPVPHALAMLWNGVVGVAGLPATSVPIGVVDGLPLGVQVVAPYLHDRRAIAAAATIAELLGTAGLRPPE